MDDKTRQLLDKSQQYLRSAAVLLEVGDYDSCVSRAYFAMFYAAQAALSTTGMPVKSRRSVRSAFVERFVDGGRFPQRAADVLHRAYDLQETADYAQRPVVEEGDAEQALSEAEAFIGSIDRLVPRRRTDRAARAPAPSSQAAAAQSSAAGEASAPADTADEEEAPDEEDASENASSEAAPPASEEEEEGTREQSASSA